MINKKLLKKLKARKQALKDSGASNLIFVKANETKRIRPLPVGEENEFGMEIITMFLKDAHKGTFISPKSLGEKCALYEKYMELKESKDEDDAGLLELLKPKKKFVVPAILKKDKAGKIVDEQTGVRLAMLPSGSYQEMINLFMDEDNGDFTDPTEGYDLKITRTGSGQFDTEYSVLPGKKSSIPKKYNKIHNIEEMLRGIIPSYEETQTILAKLLGEEDDDEPRRKKKKKVTLNDRRRMLKKKKKKVSNE